MLWSRSFLFCFFFLSGQLAFHLFLCFFCCHSLYPLGLYDSFYCVHRQTFSTSMKQVLFWFVHRILYFVQHPLLNRQLFYGVNTVSGVLDGNGSGTTHLPAVQCRKDLVWSYKEMIKGINNVTGVGILSWSVHCAQFQLVCLQSFRSETNLLQSIHILNSAAHQMNTQTNAKENDNKTLPAGQWCTVQPSSSPHQTSSPASLHTSPQCPLVTGSPWSWPERKD